MVSEPWVQVRTGCCDFAVAVADTLQAIAMPKAGPTPLPRRHAGALSGMVAFRGSAVPVVALDRWLPLGAASDKASRQILILRAGGSMLGIEVDAVRGVRRIDRASIRRIHGDRGDDPDDADELFLAAAPASGNDHDAPMICMLEVGRLATLARVWCDEADVGTATSRDAASKGTPVRRRAQSRRCGVFEIGGELWAIDAGSLAKVAVTPVLEFGWPGRKTCGIGEIDGRKIPLVDLAGGGPSSAPPRPWMAVVEHEGQWLGLKVGRCEKFVDLEPDQVTLSTAGEWSSGSAVVAGLALQLLDVEKLFNAVPEAGISRPAVSAADRAAKAAAKPAAHATPPPRPRSDSPGAAAPPPADVQSHYLVFEADRRYASPIEGVLGVMRLPAQAIDELNAGRRATVAWRGKTLSVVNMPPIDGGTCELPQPHLAVILRGADAHEPCSGIAIRSLTDWLPAEAAARRGLRMNSVGDLSVVSSARHSQTTSLVVVDLAEMAYLLS